MAPIKHLCFTSSLTALISTLLWMIIVATNIKSLGFGGHHLFSTINRRQLLECPDANPALYITSDVHGPLLDSQKVTVTVGGVSEPSSYHWIAVVSPSDANVTDCLRNKFLYTETGDLASLPLLCHYPIKFQYLSQDPSYMPCSNSECSDRSCQVRTCSGSLSFDLINIRTDIKFVFFAGGFDTPCILAQSDPISFANPKSPLYGHLSSLNSTGTSMRLTWVSGDSQPQTVKYANSQSAQSTVTTFQSSDMCGNIFSPATNFGWHDPGFIHTAIMDGLSPSTTYYYQYGSNDVGWTSDLSFKTPPAAGSGHVDFITFGDMGKAPRDGSLEHYIQPGALNVIDAIANETAAGNVDLILHIGDISYATGFLVEWDYFLNLIFPVASSVSYMTAIGNHERDFPDSGSVYQSADSGGECGVPYEAYFQMPAQGKDKPWYSFEAGPVHFTIMSTEHEWTNGSEQYNWIQADLASVNRARTPWLVFAGHRPQYSSLKEWLNLLIPPVDPSFVSAIEPLIFEAQADLVLWGHVHNYERTCAVYQSNCLLYPFQDGNGLDTYQSSNYSAPVHTVIGMAGYTLDIFGDDKPPNWSLSRISQYGYARVNATETQLLFQFITVDTGEIKDSFQILKP